MPPQILIVDDEPHILSILKESLTASGFEVSTRSSGEEALAYLADHQPDLMVVDLRMPGISGLDLIRQGRKSMPDTEVIILTGYGDMKSAVEALRLGAYDYLTKPVDMERLLQTLRNGADRRRLVLQNRSLIRSLEESNRIKAEFINGMSHEFRTPLGHILGFSQILQDTLEDLTEKQIRYIENIQSAASGLLGLFENILQFSILKSGEAHVKPAAFTPTDLLERSLLPFRDPAMLKGLTLSHECAEPDRSVTADPEICRKALSCLLDNAVKFTPDGGTITVSAEVRPSPDLPPGTDGDDLAETIADGWLHIAVADSGPGIAQEHQERIFGLFEQGDASLTRHHQGTGLGLALARSLAKIHGGSLVVDSRPGAGSTFTLILPLSAS